MWLVCFQVYYPMSLGDPRGTKKFYSDTSAGVALTQMGTVTFFTFAILAHLHKMWRKSYCTTVSVGSSISKMLKLKFLHLSFFMW